MRGAIPTIPLPVGTYVSKRGTRDRAAGVSEPQYSDRHEFLALRRTAWSGLYAGAVLLARALFENEVSRGVHSRVRRSLPGRGRRFLVLRGSHAGVLEEAFFARSK